MDFYQEIITEIKKKGYDTKQWAKLKRELCLKHKLHKIPTNIEILLHAPEQEIPSLNARLLTKPTRTISGVAPIAVMTSPSRCPHGKCTYCPGGIDSPWGDVPQSYTGHEPATMRGKRNRYSAYLQVFNRLQQYVLLGHNFEKIEIIIMGGTFTAEPKEYQEEFVRDIFQALNDFSALFFRENRNDQNSLERGGEEKENRRKKEERRREARGNEKSQKTGKEEQSTIEKKKEFDYLTFKGFFELPSDDFGNKEREHQIQEKILGQKKATTLEQEQLNNETSPIKCVALCIETKPDWGLLKHGNEMLRQGCTRVELGIQSVYDEVLKFVHRGHDSKTSKESIRILRDLGFKINFHYMPGLPLTSQKKDLAGMKQLFSDPDYRPDMIKIYPCMVGEGTPLYQLWKEGKFKPITTPEASVLITEWKKSVPEYCRIQRVQRDVPTKMWAAGVDRTNLRQYIVEQDEKRVASMRTLQGSAKIKSSFCRCIRCREPKGQAIDLKNVIIKVVKYPASKGKEFFISAEDSENDLLLGFCRLRFPSQQLRDEITKDSALIRELHVYGTAIGLGEEGEVQHHGFGKKLMHTAEEICRKLGKKKMIVISGIGVKKYYEEKLGYHKEGPYMVKEIR